MRTFFFAPFFSSVKSKKVPKKEKHNKAKSWYR